MVTTSADAGPPKNTAVPQNSWLVIGASSLGTVFEWYDFYLYGLVASIISAQFFSGVNEVTGFIFALAAFAAGFAVRPFGALGVRPPRRSGRAQAHLSHHHGDHGRIDLCGGIAAELRRASACWRRFCSSHCVCCRASRSAANMAARRSMLPSMRRRENAAFSPASFKRLRRWGSSPRCSSSS